MKILKQACFCILRVFHVWNLDQIPSCKRGWKKVISLPSWKESPNVVQQRKAFHMLPGDRSHVCVWGGESISLTVHCSLCHPYICVFFGLWSKGAFLIIHSSLMLNAESQAKWSVFGIQEVLNCSTSNSFPTTSCPSSLNIKFLFKTLFSLQQRSNLHQHIIIWCLLLSYIQFCSFSTRS